MSQFQVVLAALAALHFAAAALLAAGIVKLYEHNAPAAFLTGVSAILGIASAEWVVGNSIVSVSVSQLKQAVLVSAVSAAVAVFLVLLAVDPEPVQAESDDTDREADPLNDIFDL